MKPTPIIAALSALVLTSCVVSKDSGGTTTYKPDTATWAAVANFAAKAYAAEKGIPAEAVPRIEVVEEK